MADFALRAVVEGAQQAKTDLGQIAESINEAATTDKEWAAIQARLTAAGAELRAEHEKRAQALQNLKDHTADLVKQFQEQEAAEQAVKSGMMEGASAIGEYALRVLSFTAVVGGLVEAYQAGRQAALHMQEEQARLSAVLDATGGTVGRTKEQLLGMADALSKATTFDHTSIERSMAVLLSFSNVQGEVFDQAIKAGMNLSATFGMELPNAMRLLGRSLEEPTAGFGMLGRYVGALSPLQKEMIKDLNESGDAIGAQNYLLDILNSRMKDVAETMGATLPGKVKISENAWKQFMETLGNSYTQEDGLYAKWIEAKIKGLNALTESMKFADEARRRNTFNVAQEVANDESRSDAEREQARQTMATIRAQNEARERARYADEQEKANAEKLKTEMRAAEADLAIGAANIAEIDRQDKEAKQESIQRENDRAAHLREINSELNHELSALEKERRKEEKQAHEERIMEDKARGESAGIVAAAVHQTVAMEIEDIQKTVFWTREGKLNALLAVRKELEAEPDLYRKEIDRIDREIQRLPTIADDNAKRIRQVFGNLSFDTIAVFGGIHTSLQQQIYGVLSGAETVSQGVRGFFKGMIDAILQELSRLAANQVFMWLTGLSPSGAVPGQIGGLLGGMLNGIGSAVGGAAAGGGGGGGLGGFLGSLFGGGGGAQQVAGPGMDVLAGPGEMAGGAGLFAGLFGEGGISAALSAIPGWGWAAAGLAALFGGGLFGGGGHPKPEEMWWMGTAQTGGGLWIGDQNIHDHPGGPGYAQLTAYISSLYGKYGSALNSAGLESVHLTDPAGAGWAKVLSDFESMTNSYLVQKFGFATGTDTLVTSPTLFAAGEAGPERVTVSPVGAAHGGLRGGGNTTVVVQGMSLMDNYSARRMAHEIARMARG